MSAGNGTHQDVDVDLRQLVTGVVRSWRVIALVAFIATLLALAYVMSATPQFRAETRILIEPRESVFTRPQSVQDLDRPALDEETVLSQVELITSSDLLRGVADRLDLATSEEFAPNDGVVSRVLLLLGLKSEEGTLTRDERVIREMRERLSVYRVDKSRVIVIEFSSSDPKMAADVPNALSEAYIASQRDAKVLANADATAWLEPEIAALRDRVREAEAKAAAFRSGSDLLVGQNNAVLATQQLAEISTELSRVRANRAASEANAEGVRAALAGGASLEALPDVLASGLVQRLREREVQLKAEIADLSATLLDNHPRIRSLRSQLADLETQIRAEARRLLAGLETEAATAKLREDQLSAELNRLKAESARAGEETVELRALEREAAAQRELLESYLARYREAASRGEGGYAPVDARVISRAIEPSRAFFPKPVPILAAAFVGSLLLMAVGVMLNLMFSGQAFRPAPGARRAADERRFHAETGEGLFGIDAALAAIADAGARRVVMVSPAGDEAAATAVLLARRAADRGVNTVLVDLTAAGAAGHVMLEGEDVPGMTDLLASEASIADIVHADPYSDCDVVPAGRADPERAMRAAGRLPIVLDSLKTAYDLVVVECGAVIASEISALCDSDTAVMVSAIEAGESEIARTVTELEGAGLGEVTVVAPEGVEPARSRRLSAA